MKIAYITRTAFGVLGGGASYYFPERISGSESVMVIAPTPAKSFEEITMSESSVRVLPVLAGRGEAALYQIYSALKDFNPDVIHVFQSPSCLLYAVKLKDFFPHSKWILDFRSPPTVSGLWDKLRVRLRYIVCQFYYDRIFSHSLKTVRQNIPLRFVRVHEVCPGVELAAIGGRPEKRSSCPERFVYVGSVTASRRLEVLVDAFVAWAAQVQRPVCLDIYGAGNALDELRERVRQAGGEQSVVFHGVLDQRALFERLPSYDIGVAYVPYDMFSRAPSLKSLEYAAAGLSILASDTVGHRDYAKRFGFQFNFFSNDRASILAVLERISHGFETLPDTAVNLRCVEQFDWSTIVRDQLLPVYKEMIKHD